MAAFKGWLFGGAFSRFFGGTAKPCPRKISPIVLGAGHFAFGSFRGRKACSFTGPPIRVPASRFYDCLFYLLRHATWMVMWRMRAIVQTLQAFLLVTLQPLVSLIRLTSKRRRTSAMLHSPQLAFLDNCKRSSTTDVSFQPTPHFSEIGRES